MTSGLSYCMRLFYVICVFALCADLPSARAFDNPGWDPHGGTPVGDGDAGEGDDGDDDPPPCGPCDKNCRAGDPVYPASGKFYVRSTDVRIPGYIPLVVERTYSTKSVYNGLFGYGWTMNYNERLYRHSSWW